MKRLTDIIGAAMLMVVFSPLMLLCAAAIRVSSPGPVLFRQRRLGLRGAGFTLLKFRSMHVGATDLRNEDGSTFSSNDDPRVTLAGRIMRQTSLDELPQFLNVLRGDMSLVGPRPDQLDQLQFYTGPEKRKLEAKPGLTGLAQISGRNSITWQQRKELDIAYVDRQSLVLDLTILFRTIPYVLRRSDVNTFHE